MVESLFLQAEAPAWGLTLERFQRSLEISAQRQFTSASPGIETVQRYLTTLHLKDLALACACAEGIEPAWEYFVATYRQYIYSAAAAVIRRPSSDAYVREFADSMYATLYGQGSAQGHTSLFEHFHGRSKLTTWLRAVLAQRYVDVIRREKKFDALDDGSTREPANMPVAQHAAPSADPHRSDYLRCLADALRQAVAMLPPADRARLYSYYFEGRILADIAREFREHEATASRKLERIRRELKENVIEILRSEKLFAQSSTITAPASRGMDDAQIKLCFEYAVEEWPFDLDGLLRSMNASRAADEKSRPQKVKPQETSE
jgi:RNA polymerase sigma factor (sigma-70 family)